MSALSLLVPREAAGAGGLATLQGGADRVAPGFLLRRPWVGGPRRRRGAAGGGGRPLKTSTAAPALHFINRHLSRKEPSCCHRRHEEIRLEDTPFVKSERPHSAAGDGRWWH